LVDDASAARKGAELRCGRQVVHFKTTEINNSVLL